MNYDYFASLGLHRQEQRMTAALKQAAAEQLTEPPVSLQAGSETEFVVHSDGVEIGSQWLPIDQS